MHYFRMASLGGGGAESTKKLYKLGMANSVTFNGFFIDKKNENNKIIKMNQYGPIYQDK